MSRWLPSVLVDEAASAWIERAASRLAPVHCAGYEVRLDDDPTVDLIHRVRGCGGEPQLLRRHISEADLERDPHWSGIARLCDAWCQPVSAIQADLVTAFLSFDAAPETPANGAPCPSAYLSLEPGAGRRWPRIEAFLEQAGTLLRGAPFPPAVLAGARRCHRALPEGAGIADVGIMLSRPIEAVRLVAADVPRAGVPELAARLDWLGRPPDVEAALELVPETFERLIVSLDVGERVFPKVGLEYDPGPFDHAAASWRDAIDALVAAGLCSPAKRDALLAWPGHTEPTDADDRWPGSLLVDSLLNRSDQFMVLARRLTFLKLVCSADEPIRAKAYFGFGPRSFAPEPATTHIDQRTAVGRPGFPDVRPTGDLGVELDDAIRRGAGFVRAQQRGDGTWIEFSRILGGTDEWVTGYVGRVLAMLGDDNARAAAARGWQALVGRRTPEDGWAYNGDLPVDADSTLWAIRLAEEIGRSDDPRSAAALRVLDRHRLPDGGVATYEPDAESGLRRLLGDLDIGGMFVSHVCVTAAAAGLDPIRARVEPFLVDRQEVDGRWRGYWWSDDEYTTALAVEGLQGSSSAAASAAVAAAAAWATRRLEGVDAVRSRELAAPSVFATALATEVLLLGGSPRSDVARPLAWLLAHQGDDGGWPASALMRMPSPEVHDGDARPGSTTISLDDNRVFTSATVLRVLTRAAA